MHALEIAHVGVVVPALDADLRTALGGSISGISVHAGTVTVWFYDAPTTPQTTTAQNTVAAHDPAFFSTNKLQIANNGTDEATITLQLPHTNQASVVPLVNGIALPALTLVNQQATFVVSADESFDAGDTLTITVQTHPCEPLVIGVMNAR